MQVVKPKRRYRLWQGVVAVALLLAMMVLAACGGGGEAPSAGGGGGEPLTRLRGNASPGAESPAATPGAVGERQGGTTSGGGGTETTVNMPDGLKFDPADITIPKGGIVTWINTSDLPHTATDDPSKASNPANAALPSGAEPWDSGNVDPGGSWSYTFDTPGTYKYFCVPHEAAGMVGTITVTP